MSAPSVALSSTVCRFLHGSLRQSLSSEANIETYQIIDSSFPKIVKDNENQTKVTNKIQDGFKTLKLRRESKVTAQKIDGK